MKYKVFGTVKFNVSLMVDANSEEEAELKALDRMEEGTLDSFHLEDAVGDNEVDNIVEMPDPLHNSTRQGVDREG